MRPESIRVGMYTFNSRLGTRITAYKSGSRFSNCAARSNRDIIDSNGLSSLISLMSSTSAVVICNLRRLEHSRKLNEIHRRSKMVTHEVRRRNQPIYFIHDDLDATQSCVITSKPASQSKRRLN